MPKGGSQSATEYGSYVWGQNQQPVPGSGNLIQAVGNPTQLKGGKRKGGKGILTAAAVPALLIAANHFYRPRRSRRKSQKKVGGSNTQEMLTQSVDQLQTNLKDMMQPTPSVTSGGNTQEMLNQSVDQLQRMMPTTPSATVYSNSNPVLSVGGKGLVESVAVPAILLTANHLYRPSSMKKKTAKKRFSRSRR